MHDCNFYDSHGNNTRIGIDRKVINMRSSEKGMKIQSTDSHLFGVNFHDFIEKEPNANSFELASEFGISMRDVKKLKKHLERS